MCDFDSWSVVMCGPCSYYLIYTIVYTLSHTVYRALYIECSKQCDPTVTGGKIYGGNKNNLGIRRRRRANRLNRQRDDGVGMGVTADVDSPSP